MKSLLQIVSGQGTDTITVDASHTADSRINAAVEVVGLSRECENRNSMTTVVGVVPYKFDEFGSIRMGDLKARLDNFAIFLQKDGELLGYIITYSGRYGTRGEGEAWAAWMREYLLNTRSLEPGRLITLDGGHREDLSGEFWLSPWGAAAPNASPTVDPIYTQPRKLGKKHSS